MGIPARATFASAFREPPPMPVRVLAGLAVVAAVVLAAANVWLGDLNQDEGWYLYAAQCVADGRLPYADFAFTQGPVLPFAYALATPLVKAGGVAAGRVLTALLGLLAAGLAAALARRLAPRARAGAAGVAAFALIAVNAYQSYFTSVVKTYALGAVWLLGGFLLLSHARGPARRGALVLAGVLLALAAGTRLSAGIVLPLVALGLWRERRAIPAGWFWFCAGSGLTLAVVFGPLLWIAPEGVRFGLLDYHAGRRAGSLLAALVFKAGFLSRTAQAYLPAAGVALAAAAAWWWRRRARPPAARDARSRAPGAAEDRGDARGAALAGLAFAAMTLVHFAAPFPYDDYQVMVYPLGVAALAAFAARFVAPGRAAFAAAAAVLAVCALASVASPVNQEWFVRGRDRIWWRLKARPALAVLRDAARQVQALAPEGTLLLTQDTYLAVEANRRVPQGMELGPFCYYPDWSTERAVACRVLNRPMFEALLATVPAPAAAFSGYGLAIASPGIVELPAAERADLRAQLEARYARVGEVDPFGQAHTRLEIFRLRR